MQLSLEVLKDLELKAARELKDYMECFRETPSGGIACPWLHHWLKTDRRIEGFIVMQDWGKYDQSLADAMKNIEDAFKADRPNSNADRTLVNLVGPRSPWQKALAEGGGWWCMNAVWGRRNNVKYKSSVGYLGDPVHKRAFEFWGSILLMLHDRQPFRALVLAGGWARFDELSPNQDGSVHTEEYFKLWKKWLSKGTNPSLKGADVAERLSSLDLQVYDSWHPAAWRRDGSYTGESGPPI